MIRVSADSRYLTVLSKGVSMRRLVCWLAVWFLGVGVSATPAQDAAKPVTRIVFGSCANQNNPCPIWEKVAEQKPELLVLLGDNIYADLEDGKLKTADPAKIASCYQALADLPAFQALRGSTKVLATWDDHDYGDNDAGVEYPHKEASQKLFLDFFGVPADSPRRERKGVYHAEVFGPPGRRVQVIMLDGRYHRSKLAKGPYQRSAGYSGTIAPYLENKDPAATLLGEEQWAWLAEQLRQPADLRLIGSGIQVVSEDHPFEKWTNIPAERARLYKLIRDTKADGVVLLSGDRHHGELSMAPAAEVGYPLYDVTSSGFNQAAKTWRPAEANRHRVAAMPFGDNFGVVAIDWEKRAVSLQLRDDGGEVVVRHTVPLDLLKTKTAAGAKSAAAPKAPLPAGVIGPEEAIKKVGEEVTVQMEVAGGRAVSGGKRILLNSEKDFRATTNFTVVVNEKAMTGRFEKATFETFDGKTVRAKGKVTLFKDAPQVQIDDAARLEIVEAKKE